MTEPSERPQSDEAATQALLSRIFGIEYAPPPPQPRLIEAEDDWLSATSLDALLVYLQPRVTRRKPLLLAVAGCRRIWHLITDVRLRELVDVAERFADGAATKKDIRRAAKAVCDPNCGEWSGACYSAVTSLAELDVHPMGPANIVTKYAPLALCKEDESIRTPESRAIIEGEIAALVTLTRDIFGNPFRPIAVAPSWLTPTVVPLAKGIYQDRAFDRMPILADALQDAGCENADILNHCRDDNQVHVRGCWVVDLVLGKS